MNDSLNPDMTEAERRALAAEALPAFGGFKLLHLKAQIEEILTQFGRNGFFEEYTKHDLAHLHAMLKIYDWLLPADTKEAMSPADWALLVSSTYLHDLGLIVTKREFSNRMNSHFASYRDAALNSTDSDSRDYGAFLDTLEDDERERFLYQEFVRLNHAVRIRSWLQERPDPSYGYDPELGKELRSIFAGVEPAFVSDLGVVCESHHLDDLHDTSRYLVSQAYGNSDEETANVQFTAIALRAADLLHITRDRTPAIAFRLINPANPYSQKEWAKQSAVRAVRPKMGQNREGDADPSAPKNTIEIFAEFKERDGFFGLGSYITYAQKQLQQCNAWAAHSNQKLATGMRFPWRYINTEHVKTRGFMAEQFYFTIDQTKILDLLTGHTLYNDSGVVVRELVQNSLDAVRLQSLISEDGYTPKVRIHWSSNDNILEVTDNGTGMNLDIIKQNFLRVGSSRYQENSFKREYPGFSSISRFGIGVLSTFMISDEVEVITCDSDDEQAREILLTSVHTQYLVGLLEKDDVRIPPLVRERGHGTSVRIRIRHSANLDDVESVLRKWIVLPRADVSFSSDQGEAAAIGFTQLKDALLDVFRDIRIVDKYAFRLNDQGDTDIRVIESDGVEIAYAVRWNPYFQVWDILTPEELSADDRSKAQSFYDRLGISIEGVRVESGCPGFIDGDLLAIANVSGSRAPKTNVARTALEKTSELDEFLLQVYRSYCRHLKTEANAIVSERNFSTTKAASEISFLSSALAISQPVDKRSLDKALREVPAFVREFQDDRQLLSIAELVNIESFITLDSRLIRSVEYLLAELPGGITLYDIAKLSGKVRTQVSAPDATRVCTSRSGIFLRLFHAEWQPKRIDVDGQGELRVTWERFGEENSERKWKNPQDLKVSASTAALQTYLREQLRSRYYLGRRSNPDRTFVTSFAVPTSGLEEFDAVKIEDSTYLLPMCRPLQRELPPAVTEDWLAIIGTALHLMRAQIFSIEDIRRSVASDLQGMDLGALGTGEEILAILSDKLRVFDVSNWERNRYDSDEYS